MMHLLAQFGEFRWELIQEGLVAGIGLILPSKYQYTSQQAYSASQIRYLLMYAGKRTSAYFTACIMRTQLTQVGIRTYGHGMECKLLEPVIKLPLTRGGSFCIEFDGPYRRTCLSRQRQTTQMQRFLDSKDSCASATEALTSRAGIIMISIPVFSRLEDTLIRFQTDSQRLVWAKGTGFQKMEIMVITKKIGKIVTLGSTIVFCPLPSTKILVHSLSCILKRICAWQQRFRERHFVTITTSYKRYLVPLICIYSPRYRAHIYMNINIHDHSREIVRLHRTTTCRA